MERFIINVLSSATISTLLAGALIWLLRNWISERLRNSIRHEYDQKIERYKAQLKAVILGDVRAGIA